MTHTHFTPFTLSVELSEEQLDLKLLGRLVRCGQCLRALEELGRWLAALDHFNPLVAPEFKTRHEFHDRLFAEHATHSARLATVELDALYHHWGLARLLLEQSEGWRLESPAESLELAELCLKIATVLGEDVYHPCWVADLCALAAGNLADAYRARRELDHAEEHLKLANDWQLSGTMRPRIGRKLGRLHSRLLRDRGDYLEALDRLDQELVLHEDSESEGEENLLHWLFGRWPDSGGPDISPAREELRKHLGG